MAVFKSILKLFGCGCSSEKSECSAPKQQHAAPEKVADLKDLESFVAYVVKALVDDPDSVKVSTEDDANGKVIRIGCRKEDTGKIIGKKGKTIMALRSLVCGAAGRLQERVSVEVVD